MADTLEDEETTVYLTPQNFDALVQDKAMDLYQRLKSTKAFQTRETALYHLRAMAYFDLMRGRLISSVANTQLAIEIERERITLKPNKQKKELSDREKEKRDIQNEARALAAQTGMKYTKALHEVKMRDALPKENN